MFNPLKQLHIFITVLNNLSLHNEWQFANISDQQRNTLEKF